MNQNSIKTGFHSIFRTWQKFYVLLKNVLFPIQNSIFFALKKILEKKNLEKQMDSSYSPNAQANRNNSKTIRGCATTTHELEEVEDGQSRTTFHDTKSNGESYSDTKLCAQPNCNRT